MTRLRTIRARSLCVHGPGESGVCLGDREPPLVEGAADDHAGDVGRHSCPPAPRGRRSSRPRRRRAPRHRSRRRSASAPRSPGPPSSRRPRSPCRGTACAPRSVSSATASTALFSLTSVQPARATLPPRASTETTIRSPWCGDHLVEELGVAQRRGPDHRRARRRPGARRRPTRRRAGRRRPRPGRARRRRSARSRRGSRGSPERAPSRSTTCRYSAPSLTSGARRRPDPRRRRSPARSRPAAAAPRCRRGCRSPGRGSRGGGSPGADAGEVRQQPKAGAARLLGVELDAEDVVALGRAGERRSVLGGSEQVAAVGARAEGVDEVERRPALDPLGQTRVPRPGDRRPSRCAGP